MKNGEDAFTVATVNGFTEQIASSNLLQSQCPLRWARSCLYDLYLMLINARVYVVVQSLDSACSWSRWRHSLTSTSDSPYLC